MPHEFADAIRRLSSSIRSGVRATSIPPLRVKTPISLYWRDAVEGERRHLLRVVGQEDEVRGVTGRAARVRQRSLVEQHDVAPAEPGEVPGHAVADDAGADDHDRARAREARSFAVPLVGHVFVRLVARFAIVLRYLRHSTRWQRRRATPGTRSSSERADGELGGSDVPEGARRAAARAWNVSRRRSRSWPTRAG